MTVIEDLKVPRADRAALIDVEITAISECARDTRLYEFARTDRGALPAAEPGAHIDLHLPNLSVRQYSLTCPNAHPSRYILGIKRDSRGRGGSNYIFDKLAVGQSLKISPPRNNFPLTESASHTVLFAGGIGITPIWSMVQRLTGLGNNWQLYYSCQSRMDALFLDQLSRQPSVRFHFDDENGGRFLDLSAIVKSVTSATHFYCCGPDPMIEAFRRAVKDWPEKQIHIEHFSSSDRDDVGGFTVRLARSRREVLVPKGKTILRALIEAGFSMPHSCEQGFCGACETRVIEGTPDHRDSVLTESEHSSGQSMMICCSGSKGPLLILDI